MAKTHKYVRRIGTPGHYRYFYSDDAYEAYMKYRKLSKEPGLNSFMYRPVMREIDNKMNKDLAKHIKKDDRHDLSKKEKRAGFGNIKPIKFDSIKRITGWESVKKKAEKFVNKFLDVVVPRVRERAEGDEIIREKLPR